MRYISGLFIIMLALLSCNQSQDGSDTEEIIVVEVDTAALVAQNENLPSPRRNIIGTIGKVTIEVDWGSPAVRERTIWGELVPYGEIWRAGANENTTFEFSTEVSVEGQEVSAGKYGFFLIPNEKSEWVVILSEKNDAWGHFEYSKSEDVVRTRIKPDTTELFSERLIYEIVPKGIRFSWANLELIIPVAA